MRILASGFAIALALVSQQAFAQKWTGAHVSVGLGVGSSGGDADATIAAIGFDDPIYAGRPYPTGLLNLPHQVNYIDVDGTADGNIDDTGLFGSLEAGYDYRLNREFVVGAFAGFDVGQSQSETINGTGNWEIVEAGGTVPLPGWRVAASGTSKVTAKVSTRHAITLGARLGYLVHPKTMVYALGGYSATKAKLNYTMDVSALALSSRYPAMTNSAWRNGFVLGAGVETKLGSRLSAKFEYRYSDYGSYGDADHQDFLIPASTGYPYRLYGEVTGGLQANSLRNNSLRLMLSMQL